MTQIDERRSHKRVDFDAGTHVIAGGVNYPCELIDISLQGAKARVAEGAFETGDRVSLSVTLSEEANIEMKASVVRYHDEILALHCEGIDVESISHLRRLIDLNTGDGTTEQELSHILED